MARGSVFDLVRDAESMLRHQWLRPGEKLHAHVPVWGLPHLDGIPRPRPTGSQIARGLGRVAVRLPIYPVLLFFLLAALGNSGGDVATGGSNTSGPPVMIRAFRPDATSAGIVGAALRNRGIWVLTDQRLAFLVIKGRTYSRLFSSEPERGTPDDADQPRRPVEYETACEVPAAEFKYIGTVDSTKRSRLTRRVKPAGWYHRVVFDDGSTVELRHRFRR